MAGYQSALALAVAAPAGALVDRWDRRRILIATDAGMGLAAASVAVALAAGHLTMVQLYGVATVGALGTAFAAPGRQAVLRSVVPPEQFAQAFAREEARTHGVSLAGPPIGGFLYTAGRALPFLADAVSFALSLACVLAARVPRRAPTDPGLRPTPGPTPSAAPGSASEPRPALHSAAGPEPTAPQPQPAPRPEIRAELAEAWRWLAGERFLCAAVLFVLGVNLVELATQLPIITLIRSRGGSATTLGLVLACGGVGGLVGATVAPRVGRVLPPGRLLLAIGWLLAVLTAALALPFGIFWPGAMSCLAMLVIPAVNVALGTVVFTATPPAMQGRVSSLLGMATMAAATVAPVLGGNLAGGLGSAKALVTLGLVLALICAVATLSPTLRASAPSAPTNEPRDVSELTSRGPGHPRDGRLSPTAPDYSAG